MDTLIKVTGLKENLPIPQSFNHAPKTRHQKAKVRRVEGQIPNGLQELTGLNCSHFGLFVFAISSVVPLSSSPFCFLSV